MCFVPRRKTSSLQFLFARQRIIRAEYVIERMLFNVEFDVSLFSMFAPEVPIKRFWVVYVNHT